MKSVKEVIRPTTFLKPQKLRDLLGIDVTVVTETFQHTGSFKFRAGYNVALNVGNEHIIAASSGNFGQALAYACKLLGKRCHIVMPDTSAQVKIDAVRGYGAVADLIDVQKIAREERVNQLVEEFPDAYRASAYDDPLVIEGNSTLGDEIAGFEADFDAVIVPVGGGGLISGMSTAFCRAGIDTILIGAEPLVANDAARSLRSGRLLKNEKEPQTIADGARTVSLGSHNWEIIKNGVERIIEVPEERIVEGLMKFFALANLKVEPTGALALGALIEQKPTFEGKKICIVVSGGNVDPATYGQILTGVQSV